MTPLKPSDIIYGRDKLSNEQIEYINRVLVDRTFCREYGKDWTSISVPADIFSLQRGATLRKVRSTYPDWDITEKVHENGYGGERYYVFTPKKYKD